jgi:hypothetical protein
LAFEEPIPNHVKDFKCGLGQFVTELAAVATMTTENHVGQTVRAGILDPFNRKPVWLLSVFHLELRLTVKAFVFLEHAESHKSL